jgi:hypothetical protein
MFVKEKVWVFEQLVKSEKDAQGLVAYALYKYSKHNLAVSLRKDGLSEHDIDQRVKIFHDDQIASAQLKTYNERAISFLGDIVSSVADDLYKKHSAEVELLKKRHAIELQELEKQHKKNIQKAEKDLLKNVQGYTADKRGWLSKLGFWLLSGVPSAIAALIVTALFYLLMFLWVSSEEDKKEIALQGMQKISGMSIELKPEDQVDSSIE